ncbi:MAG: xanthine dehydrogenase family protein subunit M [Candidatus Hodarchaeaceae archaeon]|nr:xanthine dehydrogenase family protein subunit M [Candidatus Hodarchaeaceae archaeon]
MPLPEFSYFRPKTIEGLVSLLAGHGADAKILAGGTDLFVLMRDRLVRPKCVIDIKGIEELRELSWDKGRGLMIGAAVTLNELIGSEIVEQRFGALWKAASVLADPTIRNRATLVGNICNASPAADTAPALLVLDGGVEVVGARGERTIPIRDFFVGVKRTTLERGEFVRGVRIPNPPEGAKSDYLKWGRTRGEDLAVVGVAALAADSGKKFVRVALSSVAPTPLLISEVEDIFRGEGSIEERIEKAASVVVQRISPISDVRASREYRLHMAGVLTRRVLRQLLGVS